MKRPILIGIALFILVFSLSTRQAFAAGVVINEVFANPSGSSAEETEFIELYNNSSNSVDISGWKISDKVKTYTVIDTIISASGFIVFSKGNTGIQLNNSDEEVSLKDLSDQTVDAISYDVAIEDKSWSRVPDGTGTFLNDINPTEGAPNSIPTPTPTPTPSSTPTPINTPTPTSAPTPTKTPSPTPAPTSSPTKTPTPSHTPSPTLKPSVSPTPKKVLPTSVLGESTESGLIIYPTAPDSLSGKDVLVSTENKDPNSNIQKIFILAGGAFLIACAILSFRFYINKSEQQKD